MVEPIMYLAIGFLVAMLLGLMIVPLVHNRAVRLTTRRMEAATPLSMAEIQADKDQLRAEFAMSARRLEMSVDQLKNKTTSQLAELGKKTDAINRMKLELGEKNATIFSLEAREKAVKEQLRATEEEFAAKTEALRGAEQALNDKQSELGKINTELSDRSMMAESRQVELVAVRAQIDALKNRVGDAEKEFAATQARLEQERSDSETATPRAHRGAQPGREPEPARHRSRSPADHPGQGSRDARQPRQRSGSAACRPRASCSPSATMKTINCARRNDAAERTAKELREEIAADQCRQVAGDRQTEGREGRGRGTASRRARRARQAAARHQRDPAAGRKLLGDRAHGKCAAARTHQRHRRRSRQTRDAARRPEFADRGACWPPSRPNPPTARRQRRRRPWQPARGRRHAGRAHPRAAIPRLPRPPAGRVRAVVIRGRSARCPDSNFKTAPPNRHVWTAPSRQGLFRYLRQVETHRGAGHVDVAPLPHTPAFPPRDAPEFCLKRPAL